MPTQIAPSGAPRALFAAVVWTLLIVGLMMMHGVSSHRTTAHASAPTDVIASPGVLPEHADHVGAAHSAGPVQDESGDDGGGSGHSAAEICFAILCGLISALAAFVSLTRPGRVLFAVRRGTSLDLTPAWLRPPDPPCLIRLSILRC